MDDKNDGILWRRWQVMRHTGLGRRALRRVIADGRLTVVRTHAGGRAYFLAREVRELRERLPVGSRGPRDVRQG